MAMSVWAGTAYGLAELGAPKGFARVDSAASGDKAAVGEVSLRAEEPCPLELRQDAPAIHSRIHSGTTIEELINAVVRAEERAE